MATHTIGAEPLRGFVAAIFSAAGCDAAEAARIGKHLVSANLTGHDSHGVIRTPRYVQYVKEGKVVRDQTIKVVTESATHAVVDGGYGFGQTIGPQAVDLGIAKAKAAGMCIVALRKSGHIGRIGDWAERAAEAGLVSIHFVNVENGEIVAPFGGVDRRFSTNPFCIGIPARSGTAPLILDFATSLVAEGKVLVASNGGKKLPAGALVTPQGELSVDPATLYGPLTPGGPRDPRNGEGAIRTFGEHKGSGLAFMCDILGGILTGGGASGPVPGGKRGLISNGMFSIYLDPAHFGAQDFVAQAYGFADYVKSSRPAQGVGEVLVPGEVEARTREQRLRDGIPLQADTWASLVATANSLGVAVPKG
jgi:hydroxycarboxylate dehydrogenase B